ncbi:MAG: oxidoreductase [Zunongwangia sp.]|uniref:Short-chain dehydrogenase n=1 Tax=Zunongwangia profunda (strain DSM 18752 / CCTCC AB 206139 / SM-A87) TaxID=655815 RepID=D5BJL7_ZUNPS|nr:SDR family oxidoreductase [Zunongwangia profunda]ADF51683.1 short-chain dehydrogenase [Zunongwangia profunda SM-A87]MAC63794.1 oxidoreductase [Flavobacteriaceae bacterium]MAO36111.1 oxidoreductase [Zunongwangia sp.]MAS70032.1 oxidoreductase [Zunongwangia sp.]|tara:strand:+ start:363 stop:1169 length:807 start_codon:yes stop_codon:yes gene_type:complete
MSKTILITGASSGLGKETAILFQSKGWNVIATMRNPKDETELSKLDNIILHELDVTNLEQIKTLVGNVIENNNIDVVFNNAGYGLMGALEAVSDEQIALQINTNLLGAIRVTKAFIPYFRQKKAGLFITTTSIGGSLAFPLHSLYQATKFGLEGWSESMSFELSQYHIAIKTIAPGAIATDFAGRSLDKSSHKAYQELEDKLFGNIDTMMKEAGTPTQIAEIVYEAATDGKDKIKYVAGGDANKMMNTRKDIGSEGFRKMIRKQFLGF